MKSYNVLKRGAGVVPAVAGFLGLLLPIASVTVTAFGVTVSSDTYTIFEIIELFNNIGRDTLRLKLFITGLSLGSILSLGSLIRKRKVASIGVIVQAITVGLMINRAMNAVGNNGFIEAAPEIGLYVMALAPISGIILVILPLVADLADFGGQTASE